MKKIEGGIVEEKKPIKISLKTAILIIIAILVIIFGILFFIYHIQTTPSSSITSSTGLTSKTTIYADTKKDIPTDSNTNYTTYSETVYSEYSSNVQLDNIFVTSNNELKRYLYKCIGTNSVYIGSENERKPIDEFFNNEFFQSYNLAIEMHDASSSSHNYSIISVVTNGSNGTINIKDNFHEYRGSSLAPSSDLVFIVLDKKIKHIDFDIYRTTDNDYNSDFGMMFIAGIVISIVVIIIILWIVARHNHKIDTIYGLNNNPKKHSLAKRLIIGIIIVVLLVVLFLAIVFYEAVIMPSNLIAYKPIIYLYPTNETKISVKLGNQENIICSYPQYKNGWNVIAKTNGDLVDLESGRNLYSLYYESTNTMNFDIKEDGFIVKGTEVAEFLEQKLAILGLTEREAEEFIVYWLPKLQENEYNYIRFATMEEINANMPLDFSVEPDTLIRVLMIYKGLDKRIDVQEQQLKTPERTGFVAVEWGGTEIK